MTSVRSRTWLLPVALFFVSMVAMARAFMEAQRGPRAQFLTSFLGPVPMMLVLVGVAAVGVVWYAKGQLRAAFRKILALALLGLPLSGFLGAVQPEAAQSELRTLWGGIAGRNLARVLPDSVAPVLTGIILLLSLYLAWRLAFVAEGETRAQDPLARSLGGALRAPHRTQGTGLSELALIPAAGAATAASASSEILDSAEAQNDSDVKDDDSGTNDLELSDEDDDVPLFTPRLSGMDDTEEALEGAPADSGDPLLLDAMEEEVPMPEPEPPPPPRIFAGLDLEDEVLELKSPALAHRPESRRVEDELEAQFARFESEESALSESIAEAKTVPIVRSVTSVSTPAPTPESISAEALERTVVYRSLPARTGERPAIADTSAPAPASLAPAAQDEFGAGIEASLASAAVAAAKTEPTPSGFIRDQDLDEELDILDEEDSEDIFDAEDADEDVNELDEEFDDDEEFEALEAAEGGLAAKTSTDGMPQFRILPGLREREAVQAAAPAPESKAPGQARKPEKNHEPLELNFDVEDEELGDVDVVREAKAVALEPEPAEDESSLHVLAAVESASRQAARAAGESVARSQPDRRAQGERRDWATWEDERPFVSHAQRRRETDDQPSRADMDQQVYFSHRPDIAEDTYRRAVDLVLTEQRCSIAMLQRMLGMSFSDAQQTVDHMAVEGVVGPPLPSGRREILVTRGGRRTDTAEA